MYNRAYRVVTIDGTIDESGYKYIDEIREGVKSDFIFIEDKKERTKEFKKMMKKLYKDKNNSIVEAINRVKIAFKDN